jgi:ABC-type multidrug transport system ATPase subunit
MSERILRALMQLFAIIAKDGGEDDGSNDVMITHGKEVVELFLKLQLSSELVEQYLQVYQEFLDQHNNVGDQTKKRKKTSVNSVKILKICTEINAELTQKQKVVVLIRLIEFINKSGGLTEQELEFVSTVSSTFNIEDEEFSRAMAFAGKSSETLPDSSNLLFITNSANLNYQKAKIILNENMKGEVRVLHFNSVGMYFCRYVGKSELYINGQPFSPERIYILNPGSSIRSSKVLPIYYSDIIGKFLSNEGQKKISFVARELEFKFKGGKQGLYPLNFREESGRLIGIMGGSGAGKSTLLNILNGNENPTIGEVLINGYNLHSEKDKLEGVIGYVSQDDLLIEELSVFQNLFYNAKLCFAQYSDERITIIVNRLLQELGLSDTSDLKVGSPLEKTISGGQRKRLNIALELIREPSVLFVDEPTSGLSSRDSENIMDLLKELALKGKLVFVVIHQPSSDIFKMFDKLLILDLGGYPIYYNDPVEAVSYFKHKVNHVNPDESECNRCGNVNPEQIFNIIEMKVVDEYGNETHNRKILPKEWNESFLKAGGDHLYEKEDIQDIPPSTFKIPKKLNQFKVFITRDVLSKLTNKQYMLISLLEAPLLSFILAFLVRYFKTDSAHSGSYVFRENENIVAFIFMSVVVSLFIGLTVSAEEIIKDRKILKRESFLNLSRGSYLASKITIMFSLSAIQTLSYIIIGNLFLGIHGMYTDYFLILFSTSCFANILGLNISASFNSAITIYILIPFLIIPQLLLSGLVVKFEKLNPWITSQTLVPLTGDLMASRWAFEALVVNQFKNNEFEKYFYVFDKIQSQTTFKKDYWLKEMEKKVNRLDIHYGKPEFAEEAKNDLQTLVNELEKEIREYKGFKLLLIEDLKKGNYTYKTSDELKAFFEILRKNYVKMFNKAGMDKDAVIYKLEKANKAKFLKLKDSYFNQNLEDLVKNSSELDKIVEIKGYFIQRSEPIFKDGSKAEFVRAHFYAPRKNVFGKMIDTYWVNFGVIWFMTLILIFTLYFDALKKLLDFGEKLNFKIFKK